MKKILSILLCLVMVFSIIPLSVSASDTNVTTSMTISGGITDIFYTIKNFFDSILGFLGGDKRVDVENFTEMPFEVPGLQDDFIPQGICYVEELDMFAVSGYMPDDENGNERYSRIYLVNPDTNESKMFIINKFTGHAGGIASDGKDIWVSSGGSTTSNGKIYHFTTDMFSGESGSTVKYDGYFSVPVKGSVLYCDGEKLWVSEFYNNDKDSNKVNKEHHKGTNHAWSCGYDLPLNVDYSAKETKTPDVILSIPDKVQGMAKDDDGNIVFSTSYGRRNDSRMYVFEPYTEWDNDTVSILGTDVPLHIAKKKNRIIRFKMPTLMEGLDYNDGKLYVIFESGANEYFDAKEINKNVWEMDIKGITK